MFLSKINRDSILIEKQHSFSYELGLVMESKHLQGHTILKLGISKERKSIGGKQRISNTCQAQAQARKAKWYSSFAYLMGLVHVHCL